MRLLKRMAHFVISVLVIVGSLILASSAHAEEAAESRHGINNERATFNYQMGCQGCHGPDGAGGKSVPDMRDTLGFFLQSKIGREYLIRVPGSANALQTDAELAEVLNWMLVSYAGPSLQADWQPYSAAEVGEYRKEPLLEVIQYRQKLVSQLNFNLLQENVNYEN